MNCIFCRRKANSEPVEHIVPEGLVGHQPFTVTKNDRDIEGSLYLVLDNNEVCGPCNNALSSLDAYLQKQLGFGKVYWNPKGTKSGRAASASRPGMYAGRRKKGPYIVLNAENKPVMTPDGIIVQPTKDHPEAVHMSEFRVEGQIARFKIQMPIRINKRFMRALHKIGFQLLCQCKGPQFVLDKRYDPVRDYVRYGKRSRRMIFTTTGGVGTWERPQFALQQIPGTEDWIAKLNLICLFYIDLTPDNALFEGVDMSQLEQNQMVLWTDKGGGGKVTRSGATRARSESTTSGLGS